MQNIRVKESLEQIRLSALEVAHGCGMANELGATTEDVALLTVALLEMHAAAERTLESMKIDDANDHDGDTQPANEKPEPTPLSEPAWMKDPPRCQCGHGRDVHGPAGPATPADGLVCYMIDCPCRQFAAC